jgi:hypothetical protein
MPKGVEGQEAEGDQEDLGGLGVEAVAQELPIHLLVVAVVVVGVGGEGGQTNQEVVVGAADREY